MFDLQLGNTDPNVHRQAAIASRPGSWLDRAHNDLQSWPESWLPQ